MTRLQVTLSTNFASCPDQGVKGFPGEFVRKGGPPKLMALNKKIKPLVTKVDKFTLLVCAS